jgi:hypothetical protein
MTEPLPRIDITFNVNQDSLFTVYTMNVPTGSAASVKRILDAAYEEIAGLNKSESDRLDGYIKDSYEQVSLEGIERPW